MSTTVNTMKKLQQRIKYIKKENGKERKKDKAAYVIIMITL
jgi:hypothetical protein